MYVFIIMAFSDLVTIHKPNVNYHLRTDDDLTSLDMMCCMTCIIKNQNQCFIIHLQMLFLKAV